MKTVKERLQRHVDFASSLSGSEKERASAASKAQMLSMRSSGYDTTSQACADIIDNSIEANAGKIMISITDKDGSNKGGKVSQIIIGDDGHGIIPKCMAPALTFGMSDRHLANDGLGKFGMGLPNATGSIAKATEIYSKWDDGDYHYCEFSFDSLLKDKYTKDGCIIIPDAIQKDLPKEISSEVKKTFGDHSHGTIIIMQVDYERLSHKTVKGLEEDMMTRLAVVMHTFAGHTQIFINGRKIKAIDPTHSDPNKFLYKVDGRVPKSVNPVQTITLKNPVTGDTGEVRVTCNYLGANFCPGSQGPNNSTELNSAIQTRNNWAGFIMAREGRLLNSETRILKRSWPSKPKKVPLTLGNNDKYTRICIDFDACLDDLFNVEFCKQRAMPQAAVWDALYNQTNLFDQISKYRSEYDRDEKVKKERETSAPALDEDGARPSEIIADQTSVFENPDNRSDDDAKKRLDEVGEKRLEEEAKKKASDDGEDPNNEKVIDKIRDSIETGQGNRKHKIRCEARDKGAFFFDYDVIGNLQVITINTNHAFYKDFYMSSSSNQDMRNMIELLLLTIGSRWYRTTDNEAFYDREVGAWTQQLETKLHAYTNRQYLKVSSK